MRCSECENWKDISENYYGTCTCEDSPLCGDRTIGIHRCEKKTDEPDALELTSEQTDRLKELDNAAHEFLKVLVNNPDLEYNMEYIGDLIETAADFMYNKGFKIYYPAIETTFDGIQKRVDYYEP